MLSLTSPHNKEAVKPIDSFTPAHIVRTPLHGAHPTYAEFSSCGRSIVATYHTDHTYIFDLSSPRQAEYADTSPLSPYNSVHKVKPKARVTPLQTVCAAVPWRSCKDKSSDACIKTAKRNMKLGNYMLDMGKLYFIHCTYT